MRSNNRTLGAVLALLVLASTGCAAIKGERVETGMAGTNEIDQVVVSTPQAGTIDEVAAVAPDELADSASSEWTAQSEPFNFFAPELFSGAPVSGADLYSTGPVLISFVSPSCEVSVEDSLDFATAADLSPSVTFVFVHTGGNAAEFEAFVENADLFQQNVIHINDADLTLWNRLGIQTQPSTVLVDANGRSAMAEGGLGHDGVNRAAQAVLGG